MRFRGTGAGGASVQSLSLQGRLETEAPPCCNLNRKMTVSRLATSPGVRSQAAVALAGAFLPLVLPADSLTIGRTWPRRPVAGGGEAVMSTLISAMIVLRRPGDHQDGVQPGQGVSERGEQCLDPGLDRGDVGVQGVDPGEPCADLLGLLARARPCRHSLRQHQLLAGQGIYPGVDADPVGPADSTSIDARP